MNNHEYLEQKFGKVYEGIDLEERYNYIVSQLEWMQNSWVDVFHNTTTNQTSVTMYAEGLNDFRATFGSCLLHAIDNLQEKIGDDLYEQGWKDLSISFATQDEVMINGMTEAETTASAFVAGLMGGEK